MAHTTFLLCPSTFNIKIHHLSQLSQTTKVNVMQSMSLFQEKTSFVYLPLN